MFILRGKEATIASNRMLFLPDLKGFSDKSQSVGIIVDDGSQYNHGNKVFRVAITCEKLIFVLLAF